jgi:hypothetical protein
MLLSPHAFHITTGRTTKTLYLAPTIVRHLLTATKRPVSENEAHNCMNQKWISTFKSRQIMVEVKREWGHQQATKNIETGKLHVQSFVTSLLE